MAGALLWKSNADLNAHLIHSPCCLFLCFTSAVAEDVPMAKIHQVMANNMLLAQHCDSTASTNLKAGREISHRDYGKDGSSTDATLYLKLEMSFSAFVSNLMGNALYAKVWLIIFGSVTSVIVPKTTSCCIAMVRKEDCGPSMVP